MPVVLFYLFTCLLAQSICTHYSCFENMGRFVTLKKIRSKIWTWKNQVAKKQGHCYSKREKAAWPLLFLNNNDNVFAPWFFQVHILHLIFLGSQTDPCFQNKNSGCRFTGRKRWNNVWCIKIRTNLSTVSLLCLVRILMHQTLNWYNLVSISKKI